jgi:hypothetical protein
MRIDKEAALALRLRGFSYSEIQAKLGTPKATLSDWFSGLSLSEKARLRLNKRTRTQSLKGLLKRNRMQTHLAKQRADQIRKEAEGTVESVSQRELLLIGAALYWGEGYKRAIVRNGKERSYHSISFTNTDPVMVRVFLLFLTDVVGITPEHIKAHVRIFPHLNRRESLRFWQKVTGLPEGNFYKVYTGISRASSGKRPYNRLPYGSVQIRVGDTKSFHRIMGWIEGLGKNITKQNMPR